MKKLQSAFALMTGALLFAAPALAADTLEQKADGVLFNGNLVSGAHVIPSYDPYQTPAKAPAAKEDRAKNRAVVQRFFQLPIGEERARLYAPDGVKQIPSMGVQWIGLDAQLKNNAQNETLFPGWSWSRVVVWDTSDPTVFWVEAEGHTAPGQQPAFSNHYVMQMVAKGGKIVLFREFSTPVTLTK